MNSRSLLLVLSLAVALFVVLAILGSSSDSINVTARIDQVVTLQGATPAPLAAPARRNIAVGDGVSVRDAGYAIMRFPDHITVELLRGADFQIQSARISSDSAVAEAALRGGSLVSTTDPRAPASHRFTVEGEFVIITAIGTQFLVAREAQSPLEWVIALDAHGDALTAQRDGKTVNVTTGHARWMAPIGPPSDEIAADMAQVHAWIEALRRGEPMPEVGEVLWPHANIVATTAQLAGMPAPGNPFEMDRVMLLLDPTGPNGPASYGWEDCNGDGIADIRMQNGRLRFDFRPLHNRVRAVDVSVVNRSAAAGWLRVYDPARALMNERAMHEASGDPARILSLRDPHPYHYAILELADGCFLGFSLTPPNAPPRPAPAAATVPPLRPEPSPSPTTVPEPICTTPGGATLYAGPGASFAALALLGPGSAVQPLSLSADLFWVEVWVSGFGLRGWVARSALGAPCQLAGLPVAPAQPPTATPPSALPPIVTATFTATRLPTFTPSTTPTPSHSPTATAIVPITPTPSATPTPTDSPTPSPTPTVDASQRPDLVVAAYDTAAQFSPGDSLARRVTLIVGNAGRTGAGRSLALMVLSADAVLDRSDQVVGSATVAALGPGDRAAADFSQSALPNTLRDGSYYLIALLDSGDNVAESDEQNNSAALPITVRQALATAPTLITPDDGTSITTLPLTLGWQWSGMLGSNDAFEVRAGTTQGGLRAIARTQKTTLALDSGNALWQAGAGRYFWQVVVVRPSAGGGAQEISAPSDTSSFLLGLSKTAPDLLFSRMRDISSSCRGDQCWTRVTFVIANQGNADAAKFDVLVTEDNERDQIIVDSLAAGATLTLNATIPQPQRSGTPTATFGTICIRVDSRNAINESSEQNNDRCYRPG